MKILYFKQHGEYLRQLGDCIMALSNLEHYWNTEEPYWTFQTDRWEQQFIDPHSEELHNLVRQISGGQKLVHIGGRKQNLRDTLALMKYAQGHIGTDSGMMHLAMTIREPHQVHCTHTGKQRWLGHVKQFKVKGGNLYVI